jgi:hypothetical protein
MAFKSKSEALRFFKEMLNRYSNKQEIGEEDSKLLMSNLERHPDAQEKIGCGVKRFFRHSRITARNVSGWNGRTERLSISLSSRALQASESLTEARNPGRQVRRQIPRKSPDNCFSG